jgi:hypothetical protein
MTRFISTPSTELRALKATLLMSMESRNILGTAAERPSKGLSSLLEGLTSFLRKPFRIPALLEIIESVLRHRPHPPQS